MNLFYKCLSVFLCAMVLNFLTVMKATSVFAQEEQEELNQSPCPTPLLLAILKSDVSLVESLLEQGADPEASLENCQILITTDNEFLVLLQKDREVVDVLRMPIEESFLNLSMYSLSDAPSLSNIAGIHKTR